MDQDLKRTPDGSLTLFDPSYGEHYHSSQGALTEVEKLYLEASGFSARLNQESSALCVLDVGLGLGISAIQALKAWKNAPQAPELFLHSLELKPWLCEALAKADGAWMSEWTAEELWFAQSLKLVDESEFAATFSHPRNESKAHWTVQIGDASKAAFKPKIPLSHIFQDPFSPKKNPELWTIDWFLYLRSISSPEVRLVSYSVAKDFKDHLSEAGFEWEKIPGYNSKRWWTRARLKPPD